MALALVCWWYKFSPSPNFSSYSFLIIQIQNTKDSQVIPNVHDPLLLLKIHFYNNHDLTAFCYPSNNLFTDGLPLSYHMEFCPTTKFNVCRSSLCRLSKISYKNRLYGLSLINQYLTFCLVCTYKVWKVCFYNT